MATFQEELSRELSNLSFQVVSLNPEDYTDEVEKDAQAAITRLVDELIIGSEEEAQRPSDSPSPADLIYMKTLGKNLLRRKQRETLRGES